MRGIVIIKDRQPVELPLQIAVFFDTFSNREEGVLSGEERKEVEERGRRGEEEGKKKDSEVNTLRNTGEFEGGSRATRAYRVVLLGISIHFYSLL